MQSPKQQKKASEGSGSAGRNNERIKAQRLRAVRTPGSGVFAGAKGDMQVGDFLLENKSTKNRSLGVSLAWLTKIAHEAAMKGKVPALSVSFTTESGVDVDDGSWVMVPEWWFRDALDKESA